jgi:hypothetical protein
VNFDSFEKRLARYRELSHACDLKAYAIVGTARVLARTRDPETAKDALRLLDELDAARVELEKYQSSSDWKGAA